MTDRHYFTDTVGGTLHYVGDESELFAGSDATDADIDARGADTVRLDTPWSEFFDTDRFVRFEATVAKPIVQTYFHDGTRVQFRKDEDELRRAQGQLDAAPWTMGHPPNKRVSTTDEIRGFWSDPQYAKGQRATLYIPADDTEAVRYAVTNDEVSVGFTARLDWTTDDEDVDAVQREMVYDHVASVENGRCSAEEGCGLHLDAEDSDGTHDTQRTSHGHVYQTNDAVRTKNTEENAVDKTRAREARNEYRYETEEAARAAAEELNCADADDPVHEHETPDGTIYMPCESHDVFREAFDRERGDEFTYDSAETVTLGDISESQREAIKTQRDDHDEMDSSEITPDMSTLVEVYERGAAAWQQSHAPGASQQQWALARVEEFLRDLRNGNALNSGADNDLAPEGYDPPSGSQSAGDSAHGEGSEDASMVEYDGRMVEQRHVYETREDAVEASEELGCTEGARQMDDGMWVPCSSHDSYTMATDAATPSWRPRVDPASDCSCGPCSCGLHTIGDAEINGEQIDLTVPDGAQSAADLFLKASEMGLVPDECGTGAGTESAEMIASGEVTADRLVSDIAPYVNSHDEDASTDQHPSDWPMPDPSEYEGDEEMPETPWTDCGDAQLAAWGWLSIVDWALSTADEVKQAMGEEPVYTDSSVSADADASADGEEPVYTDDTSSDPTRVMEDETTVMDTITFEGTRKADLDESEIPNDDYQAHYVFDADTKSESSFPLVGADGTLRRENVIAAASYSEDAEDEGFLMDVLREVNDEFDDPPLDGETLMTDGLAQISKQRMLAGGVSDGDDETTTSTDSDETSTTTTDSDTMSENESPEDVTDFYDGEPDAETLAEDFTAVETLIDAKNSLENEIADLEDDLHEYEREQFRERAERLAELVDRDVEEMVEQFDDGEVTIDEIDDQIEVAESALGNTRTTATTDSGEGSTKRTVADDEIEADVPEPVFADEDDVERTSRGKLDLSSVRN